MLSLMTNHTPAPAPPLFAASELLGQIGLTSALAESLLQDASGQSFEPIQLSPEQDLAENLGLLLRGEQVGGAEPVIAANRARIQAAADAQIGRALARAGTQPRTDIGELLQATRQWLERYHAQFVQADEAYQQIQARLQSWQTHQIEGGRGVISMVWSWLSGGGAQISLPEAVLLWNRREYLASQRSATLGAVGIANQIAEYLGALLARLDERLAEAQAAQAALVAEGRARQALVARAPWTICLDMPTLADALIAQGDPEVLVADLLGRLAQDGATPLLAHAQALGRQAAEQQIARLTIADAIELEARAADAADADPLLALGQDLLEQVQVPTWQLTRGTRPRIETLQVTPDGTAFYNLEALGTAAYGGDQLCLGFVQVQLGVAKEELALLSADAEAFQQALSQRNLYVVAELAERWAADHALATPDPQANGHAPAAAASSNVPV